MSKPVKVLTVTAPVDLLTAHSAWNSAHSSQQRANAVKVCSNTYLRKVTREGMEFNRPIVFTEYELLFHGEPILHYESKGVTINMCGHPSPTTRHRINQFTGPGITVDVDGNGQHWVTFFDEREADGLEAYRLPINEPVRFIRCKVGETRFWARANG